MEPLLPVDRVVPSGAVRATHPDLGAQGTRGSVATVPGTVCADSRQQRHSTRGWGGDGALELSYNNRHGKQATVLLQTNRSPPWTPERRLWDSDVLGATCTCTRTQGQRESGRRPACTWANGAQSVTGPQGTLLKPGPSRTHRRLPTDYQALGIPQKQGPKEETAWPHGSRPGADLPGLSWDPLLP